MKLEDFQNMPAYDKALICSAVLLDGEKAVAFLQLDAKNGAKYVEALEIFIRMQEDMRCSLAATILRDALNDL
ncbi:MAG: hypothetical protein ACOX3T_06100 [Bdellovibrionota bacterium]